MSPIRSRAGTLAPAGSISGEEAYNGERPSTLPYYSAKEFYDILQYIHDHYGECTPERRSHFGSWSERIAARVRRSF
jgi:hypothetical protein